MHYASFVKCKKHYKFKIGLFVNAEIEKLAKFNEKLSSLKKHYGVSTNPELAQKIGVSPNTVSSWRQRKELPLEYEMMLTKIMHDASSSHSNLVKIPIFEALAGCGASGMVEQLVIGEDSFVFDSRVFPNDIISKNIAMIRIVGDSMAPYLDENDWALIELRNGRNIEPIEAVYLIEYEGSVQIKRVQVIGKKAIIKSDNKEYSPFELKINEFDIVGKIVARLKFGSPMLVRG